MSSDICPRALSVPRSEQVSYEEQIMSKDKYRSIFSPQMVTIVFIIFQIFFATGAVLKIREYLVNKPLQAAGMSADNVRGWEIVRKMNIRPRGGASRANVRFWGQSLSQGHYQPTYQQARKGFIYFISLPLIFNCKILKQMHQWIRQRQLRKRWELANNELVS